MGIEDELIKMGVKEGDSVNLQIGNQNGTKKKGKNNGNNL